jgi:hypothetical protein
MVPQALFAVSKAVSELPGSDGAVNAGCNCPQIDNHKGAGLRGNGQEFGWIMYADCPLHGDEVPLPRDLPDDLGLDDLDQNFADTLGRMLLSKPFPALVLAGAVFAVVLALAPGV